MKKILFILLIFTTLIFTQNVSAETTYGKVTDITSAAGDSLTTGTGKLETKGNTTTIRYDAATFKLLDAAETGDGQRPGPAAWIGFQVEKPSNETDDKYKVTTPDNKTVEETKYPFKDYVGITPENLKKVLLNGTVLTYKYAFDWNEDNTADQYVIIEINPSAITLENKEGKEEWSPDIAQEILEEQNPATSDINLPLIIALAIISGIGCIYCFKKA